MPRDGTEASPHRKWTIDAVATFTAMMHALERGALSKAADAQTELARLGVLVRVLRPAEPEKGGEA